MTDQEPAKRRSLADFLRPKGRPVNTTLGVVTVFPMTVKSAEHMEKRFGDSLDHEPPDAVFDTYLSLCASIGALEPEGCGLALDAIARLTPSDRSDLARAAMVDMTMGNEDADSDQPVSDFVVRVAKQGQAARKQRQETMRQLKLIGLDFKSPAMRAFNEGARQSRLIQQALGASTDLDRLMRQANLISSMQDPYAKALDEIRKTTAPLMPPRTPSFGVDPRDHIIDRPFIPLDPSKPMREHQARLEEAGDQVIGLAETVVLRINGLADFAQEFQIATAASGRQSLRIAIFALIAGVVLSGGQLVYQVWKDIHDSPRDEQQMTLLRQANANAEQEIALLRQMVLEQKNRVATASGHASAAVAAGSPVVPPVALGPSGRVPPAPNESDRKNAGRTVGK
ncbi:hypothetical protein ACVWWJ_000422 [Luteibacter sp. HA06]